MKFQLTTLPEIYEYAENELRFFNIEYEKNQEYFEIENTPENFYTIINYSHFIETIYYNSQDIVEFSLFSKLFIYSSKQIPSYLVSMMIVDMDISKTNSIIDPCAGFGEVLIQAGEHIYMLLQHTRKKTQYAKQWKIKPPHYQTNSQKHNLKAIVGNNEEFKKLQENARFFRLKISTSKFDFQWFDVKYHKGDFDFAMTHFPEFSNQAEQKEFEKHFFYQMEFIVDKKIGVLSKSKISNYQKYLELERKKEISGWYYYIFKKKSN